MSNQWVKPFRETEFIFYNDAVNECCEMFGEDVYYLPREYQKLDELFGEDILSKFTTYFLTTMFLESTVSFGGSGDLFSKFGFEVNDEIIFKIGRSKFTEYTGLAVPRIGDLLFVPFLQKSLFEISYVNDDIIFYHSGDWVTWDIKAIRFQFSHEDVKLDDIDEDAAEIMDEIKETDDGLSDNDTIDDEFDEIKSDDSIDIFEEE